MSTRTLPIQNLINFRVADDCIYSDGKKYVFYRFMPPNVNIMTEEGKKKEIARFGVMLDGLRTPLSLFITDKVEDLSAIRNYYASLSPKYAFINSEIIRRINDIEVEGASVQRSFYFVQEHKKGVSDILTDLTGRGYTVYRALKPELALIMRNYLLREFANTDIYTIEQEVQTDVNRRNKPVKDAVRNMELMRRLSPHRIDFNMFNAEQSGHMRKTIMLKNFTSSIPQMALMSAAKIRGTTFNMRLTPMDKMTAEKLVNTQINIQKVRGGSKQATEQIQSDIEKTDIVNFYTDISRSNSAVYYVNVFIEMYAKTPEEMRAIQKEVTDNLPGFSIEELKYEQRQGFLSVNPLGRDLFLADANNMPSKTVGALYPCSFSCRLDEQGSLIGHTDQGGNMFIDFFLRDKNITNSNIVIVGTSGQGKSYLMKKVISQEIAKGVSFYAIDPEGEYITLFKKMGGTIIDCASGRIKINPFEVRILKTQAEEYEDEEDIQDKQAGRAVVDPLQDVETTTPAFFQHLSWLADYHRVLFPVLIQNTELDAAIRYFIQAMYKSMHITEHTDFTKMKSEDYPTYSTLYEYIDRHGHDGDAAKLISADLVRSSLLLLRDCYDGALGALMNGCKQA